MNYKCYISVVFPDSRGNVAFVCQRHYAKILIIELNLNNVYNTMSSYFNFHLRYLHSKYSPCHKLRTVMVILIDFFFESGDTEFTRITRYGVIWISSRQKYRLYFKTSLKSAINYLLNNCYFTFGSIRFR